MVAGLGQVKGSTEGCDPALGPSFRSSEAWLRKLGQVQGSPNGTGLPCTWLWHWGWVKPRCGGWGRVWGPQERLGPTFGPGFRGGASSGPTTVCLLQKLLQLVLA